MCGRYAVLTTVRDQQWAEFFSNIRNADAAFDRVPIYNAAPMQHLPVISVREGEVRADQMMWWLVPHHSKDGKPLKGKDGQPFKTFNAKGETLDTSRLFAPYFRSARCIVPVDAFYEWKKLASEDAVAKKVPKQPMAIRMKDKQPFALAGLFSVWKGEDGKEHPSFAIVTTDANRMMTPIHHRMPVILNPKDFARWLDRDNKETEQLRKLLVPYPEKQMEAFPVSTIVNNSRNDVPECLTPLSEEGESPRTGGATRSPKH